MKKLNIALCDDDARSISQVEEYIKRICREYTVSIEFFRFADGAALLDNYPKELDLLFLDIEMPFVNGVDAAREIRKRDSHVVVVFMSNFEKYAIQGYEAGAWRYLLKPITWERFQKELQVPFERCLAKHEEPLYIKNDSGVFSIPIEEICYITTYKKGIEIHTVKESVRCSQSISSLEEKLVSHHFFRCHSGFLINFDYIRHIGHDSLVLKDETSIPISKHRKKELMQAFTSYAGEFL